MKRHGPHIAAGDSLRDHRIQCDVCGEVGPLVSDGPPDEWLVFAPRHTVAIACDLEMCQTELWAPFATGRRLMALVIDDEVLDAMDAAMRTSGPLVGNGTIIDWREVDKWMREARESEERAGEALDVLAREVGWSAIVESLKNIGILVESDGPSGCW